MQIDEFLTQLELKSSQKNKCKGHIYRAQVNHYATDREIVFTVRLRKLKRKSCQGCEYCGWFEETIGEISNDWSVQGICDVEHNKLYSIEICNESRDWETGIVDDWDLCVREVSTEKVEDNGPEKN